MSIRRIFAASMAHLAAAAAAVQRTHPLLRAAVRRRNCSERRQNSKPSLPCEQQSLCSVARFSRAAHFCFIVDCVDVNSIAHQTIALLLRISRVPFKPSQLIARGQRKRTSGELCFQRARGFVWRIVIFFNEVQGKGKATARVAHIYVRVQVRRECACVGSQRAFTRRAWAARAPHAAWPTRRAG